MDPLEGAAARAAAKALEAVARQGQQPADRHRRRDAPGHLVAGRPDRHAWPQLAGGCSRRRRQPGGEAARVELLAPAEPEEHCRRVAVAARDLVALTAPGRPPCQPPQASGETRRQALGVGRLAGEGRGHHRHALGGPLRADRDVKQIGHGAQEGAAVGRLVGGYVIRCRARGDHGSRASHPPSPGAVQLSAPELGGARPARSGLRRRAAPAATGLPRARGGDADPRLPGAPGRVRAGAAQRARALHRGRGGAAMGAGAAPPHRPQGLSGGVGRVQLAARPGDRERRRLELRPPLPEHLLALPLDRAVAAAQGDPPAAGAARRRARAALRRRGQVPGPAALSGQGLPAHLRRRPAGRAPGRGARGGAVSAAAAADARQRADPLRGPHRPRPVAARQLLPRLPGAGPGSHARRPGDGRRLARGAHRRRRRAARRPEPAHRRRAARRDPPAAHLQRHGALPLQLAELPRRCDDPRRRRAVGAAARPAQGVRAGARPAASGDPGAARPGAQAWSAAAPCGAPAPRTWRCPRAPGRSTSCAPGWWTPRSAASG